MHHHSKYSPSSRAQDINRLLDPEYASGSQQHSSHTAYVDHHGDLHDPDFRHFPSAAHTHTHHRGSPSRRSATQPSSHHAFARPQWELGSMYTDEYALDEEDEFEEDESAYDNKYSTYVTASARRTASSPSKYRDPYAFSPRRASSSTYSAYSYYPSYSTYSSSTSSSPTSYTSGETTLGDSPSESSPLDEEPLPLHRRCVHRLRAHRSRRRSLSRDEKARLEDMPEDEVRSPRSSIEQVREDEQNDAEEAEEESQRPYTPTTTESLKRQWDGLALRWRFGVFRAKKRVRGHLNAILN
ncbi:hypothetical protein HGRIS_012640 [Hohenbuehelia grisea]|uniref:Uncharacterized protein n=1 Tax=Hohenbuehelia grisea TaxID=104357 RepID=A0ABR3ISX5_9AGAR